ncbi:MAG: right-handed parallel beta-helix repeat-containing protein, partial [Myxococcales bacterium]|nr:right-handed parallel beta-helix repeat-containing protein [Myxococcales bacterium]
TDADTDADTDSDPDLDQDGFPASVDCDDQDPDVSPGAAEVCDGIDNDCDVAIDESGTPVDWYPDLDGDGYGDPGAPTASCAAPAEHVLDGSDCDDTREDVFPGAPVDTCDYADTDCDGLVEELRVPADFATLDAAVAAAVSGDTICLADGTHTGRLVVAGLTLAVRSLNGPAQTVLDASSTNLRAVLVDAGADLTVEGLTVTSSAGAVRVRNNGRLTLRDSVLQDSTAASGAGLLVDTNGGAVVVEDTVIRRNTATGPQPLGGGIAHLSTVPLTVRRTLLEDNTVDCTAGGAWYGGGLLTQGPATLEDVDVIGNTVVCQVAQGSGIAVRNPQGALDATRVRVLDNTGDATQLTAGAVVVLNGSATLESVVIAGNTAIGGVSVEGAGLWVGNGATADVSHATITRNSATAPSASGLGVYVGTGALG